MVGMIEQSLMSVVDADIRYGPLVVNDTGVASAGARGCST